ncbi:hypothetical protein ACHAXS_002576 [Conticribra weissflogii]
MLTLTNSLHSLGILCIYVSTVENAMGNDDHARIQDRRHPISRDQSGKIGTTNIKVPLSLNPGTTLDDSHQPKPRSSFVGLGAPWSKSEPDIASIIGGVEAEKGRYPYTVSIREPWDGDYAPHFCGGSLIAPDIVLTAGHCMEYASLYLTLNLIAVGTHNVSDSSEGEFIPMKDVIMHPLFDSAFLRNDFSIVVLQRPVSTGATVVKLNEHENIPSSGDDSTVMGWGYIEDFNSTDVLMKVDVTPIDNEECENRLGSHIVHDDMLCAFDEKEAACYGDSGGPLIIPGNDATKDIQIGVVSWGIGCSGGYPGVYSRVSTAYDWIRDRVCEESINPPESFRCRGKRGKGSGKHGKSSKGPGRD